MDLVQIIRFGYVAIRLVLCWMSLCIVFGNSLCACFTLLTCHKWNYCLDISLIIAASEVDKPGYVPCHALRLYQIGRWHEMLGLVFRTPNSVMLRFEMSILITDHN